MKKLLLLLALAFCLNGEAQIINTVAGNGTLGYSGDGAQATSAKVAYPYGVAVDAAGNLYCADYDNGCIRKVSTAGIITTIAGLGYNAFGGDGGAAIAAGLAHPYGVTFDIAGNMYIADWGNNRIRIVNTLGIITTIAGNGTPGYSGDGTAATTAKLYNPTGLTIDAAGNLYIADESGMRIRKVNTAGIISTFAGDSIMGNSGDGGPATAAKLNSPTGVTFDAVGNLYIADYGNCRIRKVNTSGIITTIAGGLQGYSGDGGAATAAKLNNPASVSFDATGNLYIADRNNNRIRKISTSGIISTIAGKNYVIGFSGDGGPATAAELNGPWGVTFDATGNLYISDAANQRIRSVSKALTVTVNSSTLCAGTTDTLTASGATTYSWSTSATTTSISVTPIITTTYTVTGTTTFTALNVSNASTGTAISTVAVTNCSTGIKQLTNSNDVNIYPNPNNGSFVIEPKNTLYNVPCTLYDVNGKAVLSQSINGKTNIDASSLNEGIYNISLISNEGVINKRIVIVK